MHPFSVPQSKEGREGEKGGGEGEKGGEGGKELMSYVYKEK